MKYGAYIIASDMYVIISLTAEVISAHRTNIFIFFFDLLVFDCD